MTTETPKRNVFAHIFLSPSESRLRAGWRLLIHTILFFVLILCSGFIFFLPMSWQVDINDGLFMLFNEISMLFAITTSTFLVRRFIDRRSIVSLGLKFNIQALYDVLAGIVITFFMMGLILGAEIALGWAKFEGFAWQVEGSASLTGGVLLWLGIFLLVGWQEELLSRGYHLQTLANGLNLFWGVLISSSVFGLLHLGNPSASWISTLGILLAGLFLALPYILTRQLWLSIGLHIGWNFFEGVVFGFPVSGLETYRLIRQAASGPELWTGGPFGPEAGLILIPALALGALLVYGYTQNRVERRTAIIENL